MTTLRSLPDVANPCPVAAATAVPFGADALFHDLDAAELEPCEAPRLGGREAVALLVRRRELDVRLQLVVQPRVRRVPPQEETKDGAQAMQDRHVSSSSIALL